MFTFRKLKETIFAMQFVMTDGAKKSNGNPMRRLMMLFIIDVLQVLRVMLSPKYGWNRRTYDVGKHADFVYNITKLLEFIVPRYTFFLFAFFMVAFALCDTFYCLQLFKAGEINKIGPIKALRFMVAVVVTVLFSSTMKWLLIPMDCLISRERSFSTFFHGADAECTPFNFPEILATLPTIGIIVLYVFFAMTVAFFSLGTNPLACAPHVQYTGRVETLFIFSKVCGTFLPFLSDYITPVAVSTILFIICCMVFYRHLQLLPFFNLPTNMLRGGIYGSIVWLSFSSVLVSAFKALDVLDDLTMQTAQWILMGLTLLAFPVGILLVHRRRSALQFSIDRMRGEFDTQLLLRRDAEQKLDATYQTKNGANGTNGINSTGSHDDDKPNVPWTTSDQSFNIPKAPPVKPRGALEKFFDPTWERKRAFANASDAITIIRMLLMQRNQAELGFLSYMIARALEEHPDSEELQVMKVSQLRFVFCQPLESQQAEKRLRNSSKSLSLDHEYVLYAVERKVAQDQAASTIGNGVFNAIHLIEFDSGMSNAHKAHKKCIEALAKFWKTATHLRRLEKGVQGAIDMLVDINELVSEAETRYQNLLEKYPQSVQLVQAYCSFCDTVLNDPTRVNELRKKAIAMQDDMDMEAVEADPRLQAELDDPQVQTQLEERSQRSGTSSGSSEDVRVKSQRAFPTWSQHIFGKETQALKKIVLHVQICFFLLLIAAGASFGIMQFWLFKSQAQRDEDLIYQTGLLRVWSIAALFHVRTRLVESFLGNADAVDQLSQDISQLSKRIRNQHWDNYEKAGTKKVKDFYTNVELHPLPENVPTASGWELREVTYWHFGTDWARRIDRASTATLDELLSPDYRFEEISEGKLNIKFLNENAFRLALPTFDEIVALYVGEQKRLSNLTETVVTSSTVANLVILVVLSALVVLRLINALSELQHLYLACYVASVLPSSTNRKIAKFYKKTVQEMKARDEGDEDQLIQEVIKEADEQYQQAQSEADSVSVTGRDHDSHRLPVEDDSPLLVPLVERERHSGKLCSDLGEVAVVENGKGEDLGPQGQGWGFSGVSETVFVRAGPKAAKAKTMAASLSEANLSLFTKQWDSEKQPAASGSKELSGLNGAGSAAGSEGIGPADAARREDSGAGVQNGAGSRALVRKDLNVSDDTEEWSNRAGKGVAMAANGSDDVKEAENEKEEKESCPPEELDELVGEEQGKLEDEDEGEVEVVEEEAEEEAEEDNGEQADEQGEGKGEGEKGKAAAAAEDESESAGWRRMDHVPGKLSPRPIDGLLPARVESGASGFTSASSHPEYDCRVSVESSEPEEDAKRSPPSPTRRSVLKTTLGNARRDAQRPPNSPSRSLVHFIAGSFRSPRESKQHLNPRTGSDAAAASPISKPEAAQAQEAASHINLRELPEGLDAQMKACTKRHEPLSARRWVWLCAVLSVFCFAMLLNWFPARRMGDLVTLAPTINHAGRRRFLLRICSHLSRELVLNDGFSRMTKEEMAAALDHYLGELRRADSAVRLGGDLGIKLGADYRNAYHNQIMYGDGCEWRENPNDCSYPARPGVADNGLYQLSLSFMDAVESIVKRFGPESYAFHDDNFFRTRTERQEQYDTIIYNQTIYETVLREDPDLAFIIDSFSGDMFQGLDLIVRLFDEELSAVVQGAIADNRAIFIVYMILTFGGVYLVLFRMAVRDALREGERARTFVARIPTHALSQVEAETIMIMFRPEAGVEAAEDIEHDHPQGEHTERESLASRPSHATHAVPA